MEKYGVTKDNITKTIHKLQNKQLPDSMSKNLDKAVFAKNYTLASNIKETVYTFADGSIAVLGMELNSIENSELNTSASGSTSTLSTSNLSLKRDSRIGSGGVRSLIGKASFNKFRIFGVGTSGGSTTSGSGYFNVTKVNVYYENPGVWKMNEQVSYTIANGGYDQITFAGNESTWLVGGTLGNPYCRILSPTGAVVSTGNESASGPTEARYSAYLYIGGSYGTLTRSVSLLVGHDTATPQGNTYY